MKPLVTVLVVTYNHLNTFEQAIKSVLEQKTNFDFPPTAVDIRLCRIQYIFAFAKISIYLRRSAQIRYFAASGKKE